MTSKFNGIAWSLLWCVLACGQPGSQEGGQVQQVPVESTEGMAPDIPHVVAGGTPVQSVGPEFETETLEGPISLPDGSLIFSERDKGQTWKIDHDDNITVFLTNPNTGQLGLAFDPRGRLIAVQTQPAERTKIAVIYPESEKVVLADNIEGEALGRPNDLVADRNGGVYFTAPATSAAQVAAGYPAAESRVYYLPAGGHPIVIADGIGRPNGIQLSPDEMVLYVNDSQGEYMLAFDVQPDGTVRNRRNFARYEGVDRTGTEVVWPNANGLTIDSEGRVYSVTRLGIQIFSPQGRHLGTIPARGIENLAFAGPDKQTLYLVGSGAAFKVDMLAQGFNGRAK